MLIILFVYILNFQNWSVTSRVCGRIGKDVIEGVYFITLTFPPSGDRLKICSTQVGMGSRPIARIFFFFLLSVVSYAVYLQEAAV